MSVPTIFADFNNADEHGRLRMNCVGTTLDFARLGVRLQDGLRVVVSDHDELEADAELVYSTEEHIWVAKIDWNAIRRVAPATAVSAS
jgi:hypothetical protein